MRVSSTTASLLLVLVVVVVGAASAKRDRDEDGQIEQCQCDAFEECREREQAERRPCIEQCTQKLQRDDWNADEGRKCFNVQPSEEMKKCQHDILLKSCASEKGVMIDRNETFTGGRHRHAHRRERAAARNHDNDVSEDEHGDEDDEEHTHDEAAETSGERGKRPQHRSRAHNRRGFFAFVRKYFDKSGEEFVKCMTSCGGRRKRGQCSRELKCGLKRLPRKEFHNLQSACHNGAKPRRTEICQCLTKAGVKDLDCNSLRKDQ